VEFAFGRPCAELLAARLPECAERDERTFGRAAGFFRELAPRGRERVLALVIKALRDRPGAVVLPGPERPAHMHQQHLGGATTVTKHQKAGAALRHGHTLAAICSDSSHSRAASAASSASARGRATLQSAKYCPLPPAAFGFTAT